MEWVLIVDDETTNLKIADRVLSRSGIRVTALESGQAMLDFLKENAPSTPDLILLDTMMPGMDGFETLAKLRQLEGDGPEIPVIFLSADQKLATESKGLRSGAVDYIRKPLAPGILITRVQNALRTQEKLQQFEREAMLDGMTGMLNKNSSEEKVTDACRTETGFLCVLDLDSFKLINDLCGHDMGDRALILFSELLKNNLRSEDLCGRIGGDEFLVFARNMRTEDELIHFTKRINGDYARMLRELLGDQLKFSVGVSIGAAAVPTCGRDFGTLFHLADQALGAVKQKGKHSCALSGGPEEGQPAASPLLTLDSVTMILEERNISSNAMWMGREAFINIYRYMIRYMERYHGVAYRVLFTVHMAPEIVTKEARDDIMLQFRRLMQESLRNSDLMVEVSENQLFLLLPQTHEFGIDVVINRLRNRWEQMEYHEKAEISWETGKVRLTGRELHRPGKQDWVAVASDDADCLARAEEILGAQQLRVSALRPGELLDFVRANRPDLILLDVAADGLETLRGLKASPQRDIPVLLLAADGEREDAAAGLRLGAEDLVTRPFIPELLTLRVRNTIDRVRLQRTLPEAPQKTECP